MMNVKKIIYLFHLKRLTPTHYIRHLVNPRRFNSSSGAFSVIGLESSCDETAVSVVTSEVRYVINSNIIRLLARSLYFVSGRNSDKFSRFAV